MRRDRSASSAEEPLGAEESAASPRWGLAGPRGPPAAARVGEIHQPIGRFIAEALAEAGANVSVASRKRSNCEHVAEEITARGGRATALEADVAKPESIDALVAAVLERTPRLHILVNNAGLAWAAPFFDFLLDGWDRTFGLNGEAAKKFQLGDSPCPQLPHLVTSTRIGMRQAKLGG